MPEDCLTDERPAIPRAHSAAYGVENPGFAAPAIPRARGAVYGVENPGYAFSPFRWRDIVFDGVRDRSGGLLLRTLDDASLRTHLNPYADDGDAAEDVEDGEDLGEVGRRCEIAEPNHGQRNRAEVERVDEAPALDHRVGQRSDQEDEEHRTPQDAVAVPIPVARGVGVLCSAGVR